MNRLRCLGGFRPRQLSFARYRQACERLNQTTAAGLLLMAAGLAVALGTGDEPFVALPVVGLAAGAICWLVIAGERRQRAKVGAASERLVAQELEQLRLRGWAVRHHLPWHGRGDIDHVAICPTGAAFAIETKTATVTGEHVARILAAAAHVRSLRRGEAPVFAVIATCRGHRTACWVGGVLIVAVEQLTATLVELAADPRRDAA